MIKRSNKPKKEAEKPDISSKIAATVESAAASSPLTKRANFQWNKPPAEFTKALAAEIVKGLSSFGEFTTRTFRKKDEEDHHPEKEVLPPTVSFPVLIDTSVLIDSRIIQIVNSGFFAGTILVPQFVLEELQHIADSADMIRRSKGRRGLDAVSKLKSQKANEQTVTKVIDDDLPDIKEVDQKLVGLIKRWHKLAPNVKARLLTVDYNLAQLARAQGIKVLNINDMAQAIKIALIPGEELAIRISHEGKEREQGVGYLTDGTMVVVDNARDKVGLEIVCLITKIHQTPAGQLFFARLK